MSQTNSKISIIIPTLNSGYYLDLCLKSIKNQNYSKSKIEILISDGGSTDSTLKIAKKYNTIIINNPLQTAEAGKAIALKQATGEYVALIDSDNILPHNNFLTNSIKPLIDNHKIVGSEPISFTYRQSSGFIERYSALLGANDPYAFFCGIYDRYSYLSKRWTGLNIPTINKKSYLILKLLPKTIHPTIGANGTVFKTSFLKHNLANKSYLFDIDIINMSQKVIYFAKTKQSIIHSYCENSISKFYRKQKRRINDYYFYKKYRYHNWVKVNNRKMIKFFLYTITLILPIYDALLGYHNKRDIAWFFHPLACLLTIYIYTTTTIAHILGRITSQHRLMWHQ